MSDDRFGFEVYRRLVKLESLGKPQVEIVFDPVGGCELLEVLPGRKKVLVVDAMQTGQLPPGTLRLFNNGELAPARRLIGSHNIGLEGALSLGRALGFNFPEKISVLAVEAEDVLTVSECISPSVETAIDEAVSLIEKWVLSSEPSSGEV